MINSNVGSPVLITSTTTVKAIAGRMLGFYVASTTNGTLVIRDGGASGTAISGTITPAAGWHSFPAAFATNLHVTVANTISVTFFVT